MIDRTQRVLFRLCDKDPAEFWHYTQSETNLMIEVGTEKLNSEVTRDADFKVSVMNAPYGPYLKKGDHYPFKLSHFLDINNHKNGTKRGKELSNDERVQQEKERSKSIMRYSREMKEDLKAIEKMRHKWD